AERKAALLGIRGEDEPNLLADLDGERVGRAHMVDLSMLVGQAITDQAFSWCLAAYPNPGWARSIYGEPDVERLWRDVGFACRLDEPDPVAAWREHVRRLGERRRQLDERRFDALRFRGPGTDLTIGLLPESRWIGGASHLGRDRAPAEPADRGGLHDAGLAPRRGDGPHDAASDPRRDRRP